LDAINRNDEAVPGREPLASTQASFIQIDRVNVNLVTWKQAEFGDATVLRLLETSGRSENVTVRFPGHRVLSAVRCSAVEDELGPFSVENQTVRFEVQPNEIVTLKVRLAIRGN